MQKVCAYEGDVVISVNSKSEGSKDKMRSDIEPEYKAAFSSSPLSIIFLDSQGRIIDVNDHYLKRFEESAISKNELLGKKIDHFPLFLNEPVAVGLKKLLNGEEVTWKEIKANRASDNKPVIVNMKGIPLDQNRGALIFIDDVTKSVHIREEILHKHRLACLGTLTAEVIHEIQNPLSGILINAQLLLEGIEDSELKSSVREILAGCDRMRGIVDDLLNFVRNQPSKHEPVQLEKLAEDAVRLASKFLKELGVKISRIVEGEVPKIMADPLQLVQVILNLLINAGQAMKSGGEIKITITAESSSCAGFVNEHERLPEKDVVLIVSDTGPGIPIEIRSHIFDPFFTTRKTGHGLGLAICEHLVTVNHGILKLLDTQKQGAAFELRFPVITKVNGGSC